MGISHGGFTKVKDFVSVTDEDYEIYLNLYKSDGSMVLHNKREHEDQSVFDTLIKYMGYDVEPDSENK
jgi:hypothetical protein